MSEDQPEHPKAVQVDHIEVWCQYCLRRLRQDEKHDCRPALALYHGGRGR